MDRLIKKKSTTNLKLRRENEKLFPPQTILWSATASYGGIPFGWEIYGTRMTRGCRGSTQCAPWWTRTESIPFRIYRWREWVAWGRTLEEPRRLAPVTFTPTRCYNYWSSPLLCSNCDRVTLSVPRNANPEFSRENSLDRPRFSLVSWNRVPRIYLCFYYRRAIVSRSRRRDTIEQSISTDFAILSFNNVEERNIEETDRSYTTLKLNYCEKN